MKKLKNSLVFIKIHLKHLSALLYIYSLPQPLDSVIDLLLLFKRITSTPIIRRSGQYGKAVTGGITNLKYQSPLCRVNIHSDLVKASPVDRYQSPLYRVNIYNIDTSKFLEKGYQSPLCRVNISVPSHTPILSLKYQSPLCRVNIRLEYRRVDVTSWYQSPLCRVNM